MNKLPIMSVSGIRGKMGETITPYFFSIIAYLQTKHSKAKTVVIGRDTRPSGVELAKAVFRGIRLAGAEPIDIGIAPTPTTCFATKMFDAGAGIIITASHNPLPYNGYKMVHGSGRLCTGDETAQIYDLYKSGNYPTEASFLEIEDLPVKIEDAITPHIDAICKAVDVDLIRQAAITIAVDSINGAAGVIFPQLLNKLGVTWYGVHNKLDGNFVHNPEPRPEHLSDLCALLKSNSYFWGGFVFDPDADRLATMGENGEEISEEMTLALAMETLIPKVKSDVATNLSTSMVIDDVANAYGVKVIRTKIGEANVVEGMKKYNCQIGGEGNGGIIYPTVSTVRDGLCGMALLLELMAKTGKKLTQLTKKWPIYPIIKDKIEIKTIDPDLVIKSLIKIFSNEIIDTQDGLKIIREYGWVHIRPSNTEPILRCYAEASTIKQATELAEMVMKKIKS